MYIVGIPVSSQLSDNVGRKWDDLLSIYLFYVQTEIVVVILF
ncbi:hypothetical protein [Candidatus Ichthyocystis sparus]|nr:hypothetical protein [Candidatus Ichthyocystis sparus]